MSKNTFRTAALIVLTAGIGQQALAQQTTQKVKPGKGLYEIVYSEKGNAVYVASTGSRGQKGAGKVYKLDPITLSVKDSIDVSAAPAFGLGLNDKTQILYTSNTLSNSVHAIDLKTGKIIAVVTNGKDKSHTREIAVDEKNNMIYVSDVGGGIWVIDGKTNTFSHLIENAGSSITGLALNSKKGILHAIDIKSDKVVSYDLKKNMVLDSFPAGSKGAINLVLDEKTNRLFVANQGNGDVTALDAQSGKLLQTITTGKGALGINFSPAKNWIYVANRGEGTVSIIDAATYKIIANLETGTHPNSIAVDKKGNAFVTNKAKSGPRPAPGEAPKPAPEDPNGDTVTLISL
ncbi:MAG: YncE family protein [Chitinophagaceae bacterium]|nr:YncE family protein [Chitinophagaceae bacterium]